MSTPICHCVTFLVAPPSVPYVIVDVRVRRSRHQHNDIEQSTRIIYVIIILRSMATCSYAAAMAIAQTAITGSFGVGL